MRKFAYYAAMLLITALAFLPVSRNVPGLVAEICRCIIFPGFIIVISFDYQGFHAGELFGAVFIILISWAFWSAAFHFIYLIFHQKIKITRAPSGDSAGIDKLIFINRLVVPIFIFGVLASSNQVVLITTSIIGLVLAILLLRAQSPKITAMILVIIYVSFIAINFTRYILN